MERSLIYSANSSLSMFYESLLSTHLDLTSEIISSVQSYLAQEIKCVVVDLELEDSAKFLVPLLNHSTHIPLIFVGDEDKIWEAKKIYKSKTLCFYLPLSSSLEQIDKTIKKCISNNKFTSNTYSKVNINLFDTKREIMCDVYLKLKDDKFLKLFNRYDKIHKDDLEKYKSKNVSHFYVRTRDYKLIMQKIARRIMKADSENEPAMTIIAESRIGSLCSVALQETIAESISTLGLNEEAITMATFAINNTLDIINGQNKCFDILQDTLQGQNYVSEHSFVTSYLASTICKETEHYSSENITALTVAAFFHDISFKEPDNAIIQCKNDRAFKDLGVLENKDVFEHIDRSTDIVEQIEGIPKETITIISQHHERFEGGGFPKGIDYKMIHPLSVIFNLSHELALYLYSSGHGEKQLRYLLDDMVERYDKGNYKDFTKILRNILIPSKLVGEKKSA